MPVSCHIPIGHWSYARHTKYLKTESNVILLQVNQSTVVFSLNSSDLNLQMVVSDFQVGAVPKLLNLANFVRGPLLSNFFSHIVPPLPSP